ncbi:MAG: hypothetical protein ACT4RN_00255 [Pseudonocardia sp.]
MSIFKSHETQAERSDPADGRADVAPDDRVAELDRDTGRDPGHQGTDPHRAPDDQLADPGQPEAGSRDAADHEPAAGTGHDPAAAAPASARHDEPAGSAERAASGTQGTPERLVPRERADAYSGRWESVKSTFVDEPRDAVAQADRLVGELLDELQQLFGDQRRRLEDGLDADTTSTEDLRVALRRYRSFFDRLVSF